MGEPLGNFSKAEILKRIQAGVFKGGEEIAPEPFIKWTKLASHPEFFDAFLSKIYDNKYHSREKKKQSLKDEKTGRGQKTRYDALGEKEEEEDPAKEGSKISSETVNQTWLKELFGPNTEEREKEEQRALPSPNPDLEEFEESAPTPKKKPKLILVAAAALIIVLILWGTSGEDPQTQGSVIKPAVLQPLDSAGQFQSETGKKALITEAENYEVLDVVPGYLQAEQLYRKLVGERPEVEVIGKVARSMAYALLLDPDRNPEKEKKLEEIRTLLKQGRQQEPHSGLLYRAEVLLLMVEGGMSTVRKAMVNAIEADPLSPENGMLNGEIYLKMGDSAASIAALEQVRLGMQRFARYHLVLAEAHLLKNDILSALTSLQEVLKINPLHPEAFLIKAKILQLQGNTVQAKELYEKVARLRFFARRDSTVEALVQLSEDASKGEGSKFLSMAYGINPDFPLLKKKKGFSTEEKQIATWLKKYDYTGENLLPIVEDSLNRNNIPMAITQLRLLHLLEDKEPQYLLRVGDLIDLSANDSADLKRASLYFHEAIQIDPESVEGYIKLGNLETDQFNFTRAYQLLSQAVALSPESAAPHIALGKHYYKRQDYNSALDAFLKATKLDPSHPEINFYAGALRLRYKQDSAAEASKFFYQAYALDPNYYEALVEWLKLKVDLRERSFAIRYAKNLVESNPRNANGFWALGEIYQHAKEFRRAISYYQKGLEFDPKHSKMRLSMGKCYESVGELNLAVAAYQTAGVLNPKTPEGFFLGGALLIQMRKLDEAQKAVTQLINIYPNYPGAHQLLSKVAQARDQKQPAVDYLKTEVNNNPENVKYRIELAMLLMEYQRNTEAIKELTVIANLPPPSKAVEFVYDKIRAYLLLSRAYRAVNNLESAESSIKLALDLDGKDPELHKELGYVYYAQHRDKEGAKEFEYYLQENPNGRDIAEIKAKIRQMVIED